MMRKHIFAFIAILLAAALSAGVLSASTNNDIMNISGGRAGYSTAILSDPDKIPILVIQPEGGTVLDGISFELQLTNAYWDFEAFSQNGLENFGEVDKEGVFAPDPSRNGYLTGRRYPEGVKYTMEIGDKNNIVVVKLDPYYPVSPDEALYIPILAEITGDRAFVEIYDPEWGGLNADGYYYFSGSGWITTQVRPGAVPEFSQTAILPDISVNELMSGAMTSGSLTLAAPSGYEWINIDQIQLAGRNLSGSKIAGMNYGAEDRNVGENRSVLLIDLSLNEATGGAVRAFVFKNLQFAPLPGNEDYGPVPITLSGCNMEKETIIAANRVEADYTFAADSRILAKLIAGDNPVNPVAESLKTLTVTLSEASPGRWWASNRTTFTLPEGVTARAVVVNTSGLTHDLPKDTLIRRIDENAFALNTEDSGVWTLAADGLTIQGAKTTGGRVASVELTFYIAADKDFRGPVYLTAGGSGMRQVMSAAIAEAVEKAEDFSVVLTIGSMEMKAGGETILMDVAPYIEDGYTMVPVSFAARALGLSAEGVVWDGEARTVTIHTDAGEAVLTIGSDQMKKNGVTVEIPKAPVIKDNRTFLPFRVLGEQVLGVTVVWDEDARTATFS